MLVVTECQAHDYRPPHQNNVTHSTTFPSFHWIINWKNSPIRVDHVQLNGLLLFYHLPVLTCEWSQSKHHSDPTHCKTVQTPESYSFNKSEKITIYLSDKGQDRTRQDLLDFPEIKQFFSRFADCSLELSALTNKCPLCPYYGLLLAVIEVDCNKFYNKIIIKISQSDGEARESGNEFENPNITNLV